MEKSYSLKRTETKPYIKLTVKEVCSEWLESKRLTVKKSTYANYSRLLKNHIYPLLGGQAYSLLSKNQLNSFISELFSDGRKDGKGGLSSKTVKDIFIVLKSVSAYARREYGFELSGLNVPKEPRILQYRFKKVLKDCGIRDVPFHSLRHTYASLCIKKGFDVKALSELLGHSTVNLTLDRYVHTSDEIKNSYVSGLLLT